MFKNTLVTLGALGSLLKKFHNFNKKPHFAFYSPNQNI